MQKDQFGVWTLRIDDVNGRSAIPHRSKVKIRLQRGDGIWNDRIPAWIKWATPDLAKFGSPYDGIYWDPLVGEK